MSILGQVAHSQSRIGVRAVVAGVEKVGKTTLAAGAPKALLVPLEQGYAGVSVMSTPMLTSLLDVTSLLDEVCREVQAKRFQYHSLIFDSATALERLIHDAVLRSDVTYAQGNKKALTMEAALGGYGKAYQYANELFQRFLWPCDWLATNGINIVLTCHVFAAKVLDPAYGEYDTWDLLLHSPKNQKSYGKREMLTQWADLVGFLHEPLFVAEASGKSEMRRGISLNKGRVLAVNRTPGYVAGNRFGITVDIPLPKEQGWNHLAHQIYLASGLDFYNRG